MFKMLGSRTRAAVLSLAVVGAVGVGVAALNPPAVRSQELSPQAQKALNELTRLGGPLDKANAPPGSLFSPSVVFQDTIREQIEGLSAADRVAVLKALETGVVSDRVTVGSQQFSRTNLALKAAVGALLVHANADLAAERGEDQIAIGAAGQSVEAALSSGDSLESVMTLLPLNGGARVLDAAAKLTRDPETRARIADARRAVTLRDQIIAELKQLPSSSPAAGEVLSAVAKRLGVATTDPVFAAARGAVRSEILAGALGGDLRTAQVLTAFRENPNDGLAVQEAILRNSAADERNAQQAHDRFFAARSAEANFLKDIQANPPQSFAEVQARWSAMMVLNSELSPAPIDILASEIELQAAQIKAAAEAAALAADAAGATSEDKAIQIRLAVANVAARSSLPGWAMSYAQTNLLSENILTALNTGALNSTITSALGGGQNGVNPLAPLGEAAGFQVSNTSPSPAKYDPCDGVVAAYCG